MLLIPCPYCGTCPEAEFRYSGEARRARPAEPWTCDDVVWAAYLYNHDNPRGPVLELWSHSYGCGRFFAVERDTSTDRIIDSFPLDDPRCQKVRGS